MKFRPACGDFNDAMSRVEEWNTVEELEHIVFEIVRDFNVDLMPRGTQIEVTLYYDRADYRNEWPATYLVNLVGVGPIGFTDGPLPS